MTSYESVNRGRKPYHALVCMARPLSRQQHSRSPVPWYSHQILEAVDLEVTGPQWRDFFLHRQTSANEFFNVPEF